MRTEYELLAAAMASAKQSAEVSEAEHRAQASKAAQRYADHVSSALSLTPFLRFAELEGRHAELADKAAALEARLKEAGEAYAELHKAKVRESVVRCLLTDLWSLSRRGWWRSWRSARGRLEPFASG